MHRGWYLAAYERELTGDLHPVEIAGRPLMLLRRNGGVAAYDATCPHRGANLCRGGRLEGDRVICPFHGHSVSLGGDGGDGFFVQDYEVMNISGLIFVARKPVQDSGLRAYLEALDQSHFVVPGLAMRLKVNANLVIENAFDSAHFRPVHQLLKDPDFSLVPSVHGEYAVAGSFVLPRSSWHSGAPGGDDVSVPFTARAFSPTLVVSELGGSHPYMMLTATVPEADGDCALRLSLLLPPGTGGGAPGAEEIQSLLDQARHGLEKDQVIWEGMADPPPFREVDADRWVLGFRDFSDTFAAESP